MNNVRITWFLAFGLGCGLFGAAFEMHRQENKAFERATHPATLEELRAGPLPPPRTGETPEQQRERADRNARAFGIR